MPIFATMCVGDEFISNYQNTANEISEQIPLHILTDKTESFPSAITHEYNKTFSYYDKLYFIFMLAEKFNERVIFVDVDWLENLNLNLKLDDTSVYTYKLFDLNSENILTKHFGDDEKMLQKKLPKLIESNNILDTYIAEAFISIPKLKNIEDYIWDLKLLESSIKDIYTTLNRNPRFSRYIKYGDGYGEGWALTTIVNKYNLSIKEIDWRKEKII